MIEPRNDTERAQLFIDHVVAMSHIVIAAQGRALRSGETDQFHAHRRAAINIILQLTRPMPASIEPPIDLDPF